MRGGEMSSFGPFRCVDISFCWWPGVDGRKWLTKSHYDLQLEGRNKAAWRICFMRRTNVGGKRPNSRGKTLHNKTNPEKEKEKRRNGSVSPKSPSRNPETRYSLLPSFRMLSPNSKTSPHLISSKHGQDNPHPRHREYRTPHL